MNKRNQKIVKASIQEMGVLARHARVNFAGRLTADHFIDFGTALDDLRMRADVLRSILGIKARRHTPAEMEHV